MNLWKSWINVPMLKNIIKRNTLLSKISLVSFFGMALLSITGDIALLLALVILFVSAVVLTTCYAGLIQGYMTNKTDATHMASIPLSGKTIWFTHYLAGAVLTLTTLFIEAIVSIFLILFRQDFITNYVSGGNHHLLYRFIVPLVVLFFIYYSISFFVACMAGNRIAQFVFTLAFYIVPALLSLGFAEVGVSLTPGLLGVQDFALMYLPIPFIGGINFLNNGVSQWPYLFWHVVIGIGFFIASYTVYKKRPLENVGKALLYKNMYSVIKICIVLAVALMLYLLLINTSTIIYGYSYSELLGPMAIYVMCGMLVAIALEILFKNNKLFRSLLMYIPLLVISFVLCYFIGDQYYQQEVVTIYDSQDISVAVMIYSGDGHAYADLNYARDTPTLRDMVTYFNEHREILLSGMDETTSALTINIYGNLIDDDTGHNAYHEVSYIVEEKVFKEYVTTTNPKMLALFLETERDGTTSVLTKSQYLGVEWDGELVSILDAEQIERLKPLMLKDRSYRYEDLFTNQRYYGYGSDDLYFTVLKSPAMEAIVQEAKGINRIENFMQCQDLINAFTYQGEVLIDDTFLSLVKDTVLPLGYDVTSRGATAGSIVSMTQDTITLQVSFDMFVDEDVANENNILAGTVQVISEVTFVSQDGKMVIDRIVQKEVKNV